MALGHPGREGPRLLVTEGGGVDGWPPGVVLPSENVARDDLRAAFGRGLMAPFLSG